MKAINLDNVQEMGSGDFVKPVGGFVLGITAVEDVPEKEYLKITYDIAEGDMKNYFSNRKKEMGWELPTLIRSYKDSALGFFKGFVTSLENSNKGYKFSDNEKDMIKKLFGAVLAEEEYRNQKGEVKVRGYVATVHSVDTIKKGDFKVPELKKLQGGAVADNSASPFTPPTTPQFEAPAVDEDVPF